MHIFSNHIVFGILYSSRSAKIALTFPFLVLYAQREPDEDVLGLLEGETLWWVTALHALRSDGIVEAVKEEKERGNEVMKNKQTKMN
jgi:hypothetical protein